MSYRNYFTIVGDYHDCRSVCPSVREKLRTPVPDLTVNAVIQIAMHHDASPIMTGAANRRTLPRERILTRAKSLPEPSTLSNSFPAISELRGFMLSGMKKNDERLSSGLTWSNALPDCRERNSGGLY